MHISVVSVSAQIWDITYLFLIFLFTPYIIYQNNPLFDPLYPFFIFVRTYHHFCQPSTLSILSRRRAAEERVMAESVLIQLNISGLRRNYKLLSHLDKHWKYHKQKKVTTEEHPSQTSIQSFRNNLQVRIQQTRITLSYSRHNSIAFHRRRQYVIDLPN